MPNPLISADDLYTAGENILLLDARPAAEYAAGHLPGARHADPERHLSRAAEPDHDPANGGRHPLPSLRQFCATGGGWGISPESRIVIYDAAGGANAAARVWWMLRSLGLQQVQVLDGGLQAALQVGFALSSEAPVFEALDPLPGERWHATVTDIDIVAKLSTHPDWKLLDVRSGERFRGETEPLDPVAGHLPGAMNLPYTENLDAAGRFKSPDELRTLYGDLMTDLRPDQLVVHCGSGVTACHTLLALEYAGFHGADGSAPALFVGGWSEWCRSGREQAKGA